jgi:hypothetical protein
LYKFGTIRREGSLSANFLMENTLSLPARLDLR